jgi:hypothetical protein
LRTLGALVPAPVPPWLTIMTTAYFGWVAGANVENHDVDCRLPDACPVPVLAAIGIWPSGKPLNGLYPVP